MNVYNQRAEQLIERLPASAPEDVKMAIKTAFELPGIVAGMHAKITEDKRFSAEGHRLETIKALGGAFQHMRQLRGTVDRHAAAVAAERASFAPKLPDRTDLFGELQRQELRTMLRNMPDFDRQRFALETKDEAIRDAIVHAPAVLSGLKDDVRQSVLDGIIAEKHGERVKANQRAAEGAEAAIAALIVAEADMRRESGLSEADFADGMQAS